MKKNILLLLTVILSYYTNAQSFDAAITTLDASISDVKANKKDINQSIETVQPGVVSVTIEEVSSSGKTNTKSYEFNTGDIDPHTVKAITKKDVITVQLWSNKKQKMIKQTVNNEKITYVKKFYIYAIDIDNARDLVKNIKATIAPAKKLIDKRLALSGYNDRLEWLTANIGDVSGSKKEFSQSLEMQETYPGSVLFSRTINSGKSSKENSYAFNLSTLNPNSILFKVDGSFFNLVIETKRKTKAIKVTQNGEQKNYTNKFIITAKSVEQARDIQKVLSEIIPLAEEKFNASIKPVNSIAQGIEKLNSLIETIEVNNTSIKQSFDGSFVQTFDQENVTGKKTKHEVYNFNLIDINKSKVSWDYKGGEFSLKLSPQKIYMSYLIIRVIKMSF